MPKYVVVRPIKGLVKPGETLQPGQIISLDEDRARRSLETGYLSTVADTQGTVEAPAADLADASKARPRRK